MSQVDKLVEDINSIRQSMEAVHREVAGLSKRAQEQGKHLSRAELDEVLAKVEDVTTFVIRYDLLADRIQPHLATPAKVDAVLMGTLQQLKKWRDEMLEQIPRSLRIEGEVWGFTNWRVGALSVGIPLALLMLMLWFPGVFARVTKEHFEQVQARAQAQEERADRLVATGEKMLDITKFYSKQIKAYVKKNPKAAVNFPEYVAPQEP